MNAKLPEGSPIPKIQKALAQTDAGTTKLADQIAKGKAAQGQGVGLLGTLDRFVDANQRLQAFPSHVSSPISQQQLDRLRGVAEQLTAANQAMNGADAQTKEALAELTARSEAALNEKLTPLLPGIFQGAVAQVAQIAQQPDGFDVKAKALAQDLGIAGQLSPEEMSALSEVLRDQAIAKLERIQTFQNSAGQIDASAYLAALVDDMEQGAKVLENLKADLG